MPPPLASSPQRNFVPLLLSFPPEILRLILLRLKFSEIMALLLDREWEHLWTDLVNVTIPTHAPFPGARALPSKFVSSSTGKALISLIVLDIEFGYTNMQKVLNSIRKKRFLSTDLVVLIVDLSLGGSTNDYRSVCGNIQRTLSKDTVHSFELRSLTKHFKHLCITEDDVFFGEDIIKMDFIDSTINIRDPTAYFKTPNLHELTITSCNFEEPGSQFILPRVTQVAGSKVKKVFRSPSNLTNVEEMQVTYSDLTELKHSNLLNLVKLILEGVDLHTMSFIHAPKLKHLQIKENNNLIFTIRNCIFDSLEDFTFGGNSSLYETGSNFAPKLKRWNIFSSLQPVSHDSKEEKLRSSMFSNVRELLVSETCYIPENINLKKLTYLHCKGQTFYTALDEFGAPLTSLKTLCLTNSPSDYKIKAGIKAPLLEVLSIVDGELPRDIGSRFPKLKKLRHRYHITDQQLQHEEVSSKYKLINQHLLNLELLVVEINIERMASPGFHPSFNLKIDQCNFPKLKTFIVTGGNFPDELIDCSLKIEAPDLKNLSLNALNLRSFDISNWKNLEVLKLTECHVGDLSLYNIKNLKYLDLYTDTTISTLRIGRYLASLTTVRNRKLLQCNRIGFKKRYSRRIGALYEPNLYRSLFKFEIPWNDIEMYRIMKEQRW